MNFIKFIMTDENLKRLNGFDTVGKTIKEAIKIYKDEKGIVLSEGWVNGLFRFDLCFDGEKYTFSKNDKITVEQYCKNTGLSSLALSNEIINTLDNIPIEPKKRGRKSKKSEPSIKREVID